MRREIPAPVIAVLSEVLPESETRVGLNQLFFHAGAPGDPPEGNKQIKVQEWLRRVNREDSISPLDILGKLIEPVMEADLDAPFTGESRRQRKVRVDAGLARCELHYLRGGLIAGALRPAASHR